MRTDDATALICAETEAIISSYANDETAGASWRAAAAVVDAFKGAGWRPPSYSEERADEMLALRIQGQRYKTIAAIYSISTNRARVIVDALANKRGIKLGWHGGVQEISATAE